MGQNNRQRRAAKQRQRAREQRSGTGRVFALESIERVVPPDAAILLEDLVRRRSYGIPAGTELRNFLACAVPDQQRAIDAVLPHVAAGLIDKFWTPLDLYEVLRRKSPGPAARLLLDLIGEATARHPDRLVHPRWRAQLEQFGVTASSSGARVRSGGWAAHVGLAWPDAVTQLVEMLGVVRALPVVEPVLPKPGSAVAADAPSDDGVDAKVLRRVRALPYVAAKASLIGAVARANHCRTILSEHWGFVTVLGHAADLDVVELLSTSLLVQATRAMQLAGSVTSRTGVCRTRSFRQSFLASYAYRIGERLRATAQDAAAAADVDQGGGLLPSSRLVMLKWRT